MHSVSTPGAGRASGVTQKNSRNGRHCRRCHRFGTFAPNTLVCDRCIGALPLIFVVTVTVTVVMPAGGAR
jgi:hypothetical protein